MEGSESAGQKGLEERLLEFYSQWEYYCYPDKSQKCKGEVESFLKSIDAQLSSEAVEGNKKEKAKLLFLKGKILDLLPTYEKGAEDCLNKSLKLNPSNGDCWNTLAHILFKKGDISGSQSAVSMALQYKGKNKVSLRYQSVLLRSQTKDSGEERRKHIEESLQVIKQAVKLDLKDAASWYFLGNAYFSNFLANFKKFDELQNSLKAYNQAEKQFAHRYPDLYYSRANVELYVQNYDSAIKDYTAAMEIEKNQEYEVAVEKIKSRLELTRQAFQRVGELKAKKIQEITKDIPNSISNNKDGLTLVSIKKLKLRLNPKSLLTAKVISRISNYNEIPFSYLAIDHEGSLFTLSMYNVASDKVDQRLGKEVLISILNPEAKIVTYQGFTFTSVQVFEPVTLRINGQAITKQEFNPAEVRNQAFQK